MEIYQIYSRAIIEAIEHGKQIGLFRPDIVAEDLMNIIMRFIAGFTFWAVFVPENKQQEIMDVFFDYLLNGIYAKNTKEVSDE